MAGHALPVACYKRSVEGVAALGPQDLRPNGDNVMMRTNGPQLREGVPNRPIPSFGNPDLPPEGRMNTDGNPESLRSDGPHNQVIEGQFPSQMDPPATDI